jgi:hypothetical protein
MTLRFKLKSVLLFTVYVEIMALIEPERINVPVIKVYEVCNF